MRWVLDAVLGEGRKVAPGVIVFSCLADLLASSEKTWLERSGGQTQRRSPFSFAERCLLPRAGYFYPRCGCRGGWGWVTGQGYVADGPNRFGKPRIS